MTPASTSTVAPAGSDSETVDPASLDMGELARTMGIVITEASAQRVVATMPVEGNRQPYGVLHGGASAALVETVGSAGALLHVWPAKVAFGIDLNVTHHRSVASGTLTAVATAVSLGGTLCSHEVVVTDEHGHRIATGRITNIVRDLPTARA